MNDQFLQSRFWRSLSPEVDHKWLKDANILITRAAHQNANLVTGVEVWGGNPMAIPMTIIQAAPRKILTDFIERGIEEFQYIIFTSINSVDFFAPYLNEIESFHPQTRFFAMGLTSTQHLRKVLPHDAKISSPSLNQGAEGLLRLGTLHQVRNKKILLIRGRPTLGNVKGVLEERGAQVTELVVYRTLSLDYDEIEKAAKLPTKLDAVLVSSALAVQNLSLWLEHIKRKDIMRSTLLLASSTRIAKEAKLLGWKDVVSSPEPDDISLLRSLKTHHLIRYLSETARIDPKPS